MRRSRIPSGRWASFSGRYVMDKRSSILRHTDTTFTAKFTQQKGVSAHGSGFYGLSWGAASLRGWCTRNDDTFVAGQPVGLPNHAVFGVFDGHGRNGGDRAAKLAAKSLHRLIYASHAASSSGTSLDENKLVSSFEAMDAYLKRWRALKNGSDFGYAGTCAAVVIVGDSQVTVANLGDSRVVCKNGPLSRVHTCDDPSEANRVVANGGYLCQEQRINGRLVPSRALGDFCLKYGPSKDSLVLSCRPEISRVSRKDVGEFIVVGSDGIFDVLTPEEIMSFCESQRRLSSKDIAEQLVDKAIARGSQDNVTCVIVRLCDPLKRAASVTIPLAEGLQQQQLP